jgi:hypothetical protein
VVKPEPVCGISVVKREIAVVFTTAISILVDPIGIEPTTLRMRTVRSPKCDIARARIFAHSYFFKMELGGMRIIRFPQEMRMIRGELPNHSHLFF